MPPITPNPVTAKELADALVEAQKMNVEFDDMTRKIQNMGDYTKQYDDYIKTASKSTLILKRVNQDNAKMLQDEIISKKKVKELNNQILGITQNTEKIKELSARYEESMNAIRSNNSLTAEAQLKAQQDEADTLEQINRLLGTEYKSMLDVSNIDSTINSTLQEKTKFMKDINDKLVIQEGLEQTMGSLLGDHADAVMKIASAFGFTTAGITDTATALSKGNFKEAFDVIKGGLTGAVEGTKAWTLELMSNPIGAIVTAAILLKQVFDKISGILYAQSKDVTDIQKNLMLSADDARDIRENFVNIERTANRTGSAFATVKNMLEASSELSDAFGASIDFSSGKAAELVKNQIALTKELGLSGEDAGKLQTQMSIIGTSEETFGRMVAKSNIEAKTRLGVTFSLKGIMADISKLSAATFLSLSKNPDALAKAVIKAKELGVSVEKMNGIADGLLNIESSLGAQFEASVLTGKNLNFELARELSLQNDIAGATKEILSQVGSAADFSHMNRIQQDAIAKSVGMTRDELAGSLMVQENLNKLGSAAKDVLNQRLKGLSEEQKLKVMQGITDDKAAYSAAKRIDAQTKMNQLQEKMFSILSNILTPLEPIVDAFATIFEFLAPIVGFLADIIHLLLSPVLVPLKALASFMGNTTDNANAVATSAQDAQIAPDGGLMVSGAKGTYQLDKNDSVIAGTNLGGTVGGKSNGNVDMTEVVKEIRELRNAVLNMKQTIMVDGKEFGRLVKETTSQKVSRQ